MQLSSTICFQCPGYNIPRKFKCDGLNNCGDNSDENECAPPTTSTVPPPTECTIISGPGTIGSKCIFPFKHEGVTYRGCPVKKTGEIRERWCPTSVENLIFDPSSVGVCSESCPNYDPKGKELFQSDPLTSHIVHGLVTHSDLMCAGME